MKCGISFSNKTSGIGIVFDLHLEMSLKEGVCPSRGAAPTIINKDNTKIKS